MKNKNHSLSNFERQQAMLRLLEKHQRMTVEQITTYFKISVATARRDLDLLVAQGRVQRFHGGAMLAQPTAPEAPVVQRQHVRADEKRRIGAATAQLVKDGDTIFLGSGSTTLEVAKQLRGCHHLTVITNSLPVMNALAEHEDVTVVCLGGMLRRSEMSLIGSITEQALREVRMDKVIVGVRGIDPVIGLTNEYMPENLTDRVIVQSGRKVIMVADHTKFGRVAAAFLAPLDAIHTLVTDGGAPKKFVELLKSKGLQVILA